jgi:hypothetical protein
MIRADRTGVIRNQRECACGAPAAAAGLSIPVSAMARVQPVHRPCQFRVVICIPDGLDVFREPRRRNVRGTTMPLPVPTTPVRRPIGRRRRSDRCRRRSARTSATIQTASPSAAKSADSGGTPRSRATSARAGRSRPDTLGMSVRAVMGHLQEVRVGVGPTLTVAPAVLIVHHRRSRATPRQRRRVPRVFSHSANGAGRPRSRPACSNGREATRAVVKARTS